MDQFNDPMQYVILEGPDGNPWRYRREDIRRLYAGEIQASQIEPIGPVSPETVEATHDKS